MAVNALEKIRKEAQKLRKDHPKMTYANALKKAGKMYRDGHIGKVKKVSGAKVAKKPKITGKPKIAARPVKVASTGMSMGSVATMAERNIDRLEKERKVAPTKRDKDVIQRKINAYHDILDGAKKLRK